MPLHARDGGSWREITPSGFKVKQGGVWEPVQSGYVKVSGTWQKFYQNSDPVTYSFYPVAIDSWRPSTTWRGSSNMRIGSYGFGDHWTLMDFTTSVDGTSGLTLAQALAIRPAVSSCEFTLKRSGGGSATMNSGTYFLSWNNGGFTSGTPTNEALYRNTHSLASAGWARNTTRTFTGLGDLALKLATNEICVANNLSPSSSGGGNDSDYTNVDGSIFSHTLTVTLDYV